MATEETGRHAASEAEAAARLAEIEAIKRLKARHFRLLDTKQWAEWRLQSCDDCVYEGTSVPLADADGSGHYQEEYRKVADGRRIARLRLTRLRVDPLLGTEPEPLPGRLAPALDWLPPR